MNDEKNDAHPDLYEDLREIPGGEERFRLTDVLADLLLELAEKSADNVDIRQLKSELRDGTVRRFVASLLGDVIGTTVDARRCALPRATTTSLLLSAGEVRGLEYKIKGGVAEGQAVADFVFESDVQIAFAVPKGAAIPLDERVIPHPGAGDDESDYYLLSKTLQFRGLVRLGRYDRPLGGEINRITAMKDDPGNLEWQSVPTGSATSIGNPLADMYKNMNINPLADVYKNMNINPLADVYKNMNINPLADVYKNLNINPLADVYKNLNINPMADFYKNLNAYRMNDFLKNLNMNINPLGDLYKNLNINPFGQPKQPEGREETSPEEGPPATEGPSDVDAEQEDGDDDSSS